MNQNQVVLVVPANIEKTKTSKVRKNFRVKVVVFVKTLND